MSAPMYFNGRFTTTDERVISVEDRGFQYADGVYELLKFLDRRPVLAAEHLARLDRSLAAIEMATPLSKPEWLAVFGELIKRSGADAGTIYLQITRGETTRSHVYPPDLSPTFLAYCRSAAFPVREKREYGVATITAPDQRWSRCDIKSISLLGSVLARQEVRRKGADEALLVRGNTVTEGSHSNVFFSIGGVLVTHPADHRILSGTVRREVIRIARDMGIVVEERPLAVAELEGSDEIFLTATTLGVMPVRTIDEHTVPGRRLGLRLAEAFSAFELTEGRQG